MSFAVFFETEAIVEGLPQYLVFPTSQGGSVIFTRVSNGRHDGLNRWAVTDEIPIDEVLTKQPTAVLVTPTDVAQYEQRGLPATLTTKAINNHAKSPESGESTSTLTDVPTLVANSDVALNKWLRDGRRTQPVIPTPVVATPEPVVTPVGVTQAASVKHTSPAARMAIVPAPELAKRYVHRAIAGVDDFAIYDSANAANENVLLYGPTGPGKTTSAIAYAAARNLPLFMVSGTVALEPSHLFGKYVPDGQGGFVWQDGGVTELVRHGGVLILDEVNFIPSKIATVLFPLLASTRHITLLDHKGETIVAHPDLFVVGTMNPNYAGTQEVNAALWNRFDHFLSWGYDDTVEKVLVPCKSVRDLARQLRAAEASEEIFTPTPTNALVKFVELAGRLGIEYAISNFVTRYRDEEQASVKLAVDTHRLNIETDLGIAPKAVEPDPLNVVGDDGLKEWERELIEASVNSPFAGVDLTV